MSEEKTSLNIGRYLSITIVISILSQMSLVNYYSHFGFFPMSYFDVSEIILSSTKDFIFVSMILFLFTQTVALNTKPEDLVFIKQEEPIKNKVWDYLNKNYLNVSIQLMNIILGFILYIKNGTTFILIFTMVFYLLIELIKHNNKKYHEIERNDPIWFNSIKSRTLYLDFNLIVIGILYVSLMMVFSSNKAYHARFENKYIGSEFKTKNDELIKTTTKVLLVGKTRDYIFIYSTPDSSLRVLKVEELSKIVLRNNDRSLKTNLLYTY